MASINARPTAGKLICEGCGCTDDAACEGGCHWVSLKPPVCSRCVDGSNLPNAAPLDEGFFGSERCPASTVPAFHAPIWIDPSYGYCARCRAGFVA